MKQFNCKCAKRPENNQFTVALLARMNLDAELAGGFFGSFFGLGQLPLV